MFILATNHCKSLFFLIFALDFEHFNCLCIVEKMKKAFLLPLLISWLIIFVHDVIPHHHHSDIHFYVHNHSDSNLGVSRSISNLAFNNLDSHEVCSFSVDFLPRFSSDLDILPPELTFANIREIGIKPLFFSDYHLFISSSIYIDQRQLRGPPMNLS